MKRKLILVAAMVLLGACGKLTTTSGDTTPSNNLSGTEAASFAQDGANSLLAPSATSATAATPLVTTPFMQRISAKALAADPGAKSVALVAFGNRNGSSCGSVTGTVTSAAKMTILFQPANLPSGVTVSLSADGLTLSVSGSFTGRQGVPILLASESSSVTFAGMATSGCAANATPSAALTQTMTATNSNTGVSTSLYELSGVFGPAALVRSGAVVVPAATPTPGT